MPDEPNFLDLVCILTVTNETTLERFGSTINASVFDAANIAGSLKQKGLIDFTSYYPGPNTIALTDPAKSLIAEANTKATEPLDPLDEALLIQLSGGKRLPNELQTTLNIRPKDLALHLYKVNKQAFISYELKSGNVNLSLTEQGFLKANEKNPAPKPKLIQPAQQQPMQQEAIPGIKNPAMQTGAQADPKMQQENPQQEQAPEGMPKLYGKPMSKMMMAAIVLILIILIAVAYYYFHR